MRVVSITRLLDEADIIESFVRHTAHFASHLIFMDNGSRDGTLEILRRLQAEGFKLLVYQNKSVSFRETEFNTKMFRDAVRLFDADWVLCLDADEFIDDAHVEGGLLAALDRLRSAVPEVLTLRVPLYEYRRTAEDDPDEINVPLRLRHRLAPFGVDKIFLQGALAGLDATIGGGNHFAYVQGERVASRKEPGLRLAHFAERSAYQVAAKWIKGWAKVVATGPKAVASNMSAHYREPFGLLRDDPGLLLRNPDFLELRDARPMTEDAMAYRGGPLAYTSRVDDQMRSVRMVVGYLEELASRYGYLIEHCPQAKTIAEAWDEVPITLIGHDLAPSGGGKADPPSSRPRPPDEQRRPPPAAGPWRFSIPKLRRKSRTSDILRLTSRAIARGRFIEADDMLKAALAEAPDDAALLKEYALSAHNSARHYAAIGRWQRALHAAPGDAMCHAGVAANFRECGDLNSAFDVIGTALSRFPDDGIVLTEAARIETARHRLPEALGLLEKAIALCGPFVEVTNERDRIKAAIDARAAANAG